ncbi:6-phosphogluconolactonase [Ensifer sp. YR511]|uniref:6-phosphogluconolactonase n=1 Tax=Ensifer sp. YR511 TaxID=1855294 RepID=UPI0008834175|nr:6-phosphogluconolactonase [Ensifer sp. YR511]SDN18036.1 glucosamine-6-phosphate deaminase [Ensifer sp. YR511]
MTVRLFEKPEAIGNHAASHLLAGLGAAVGRPYLLGCPTGRTPRPVYAALAEAVRYEPLDISHLVLVMMDEYTIEDGPGRLRPADPFAHFSCRGFADREIVAPINAVLPPEFRIRSENIWFPDVNEPASYDKRIAEAGGIDCFLVASGSGDGHVAFNPPGSELGSLTRIVTLAEQTRIDNLKTFPAFENLDAVPRHGVSVGLQTIRSARHCMLLLWGREKREAFRRVTNAAGFDADWPASIVLAAASHDILADHAAADNRR